MKSILCVAAISMSVLPALAQAHHSAAEFDLQHPVIASGTVKSFFWGNPHTWIYLLVPNGNGSSDEWVIEGTSVVNLARDGWTKDSVKPGDKIKVTIAPRKDGGHAGTFFRVQLADGSYLLTPRVDNSAILKSDAKIIGR